MSHLIISRPCSPSNVLSNEEVKTTEILVSWGGGMGGANKKYYAVKQNGNTYTVLPHMEEIELNPNFIVHKKEVKLLKMVTDITEHSNFTEKTCESNVVTEFFLIPKGYTYEVVKNGVAEPNFKYKLNDLSIFKKIK